jgi:hypothetical protein
MFWKLSAHQYDRPVDLRFSVVLWLMHWNAA